MSLWCGACRTEIFEGFGLLYRMDLVDGTPRTRTADRQYVPPNSAICDRCWERVPGLVRLTAVSKATEPGASHVFAYTSATGSNSPIWGSKQWSDIEPSGYYVYLRPEEVEAYLPQALAIIARDADEKAACAAS